MKKILFASTMLVGLAIAGTSQAADSTGCGLGSMIFKGQRGPIMQLLAVTTNDTICWNQTFGISSGTLGCDRNGTITGGTGRMISFLNGNMDQFAMDAVKGEGETIDTIASIMNVPSEKVGAVAQEHFDELFASENTSGREIGLKLAELLSA